MNDMTNFTKIKDIGEFGLIRRIGELTSHSLPSGFTGIGDDCAIIPGSLGAQYAVSTDLLVEGVHFVKSEIGGRDLGYKSLAVNLSDLAAAGATPCGAFLSLALPEDTDVEFVDEFSKGFDEISKAYGCPLLGGDTTGSKSGIVVNVCVIGHRGKNATVSRSGSKPGDIICVTGALGDSGAGLEYVLNPALERDEIAVELIKRHHRPVPRVEEGKFLAQRPEAHSMMDISDGVASDLPHILERSSVSAEVELENLPVSDLLQNKYGSQPSKLYHYALHGGEDYELLLTVDSRYYADLSAGFEKKFGKPLCAIGRIVAGDECKARYIENGFGMMPGGAPWSHFC